MKTGWNGTTIKTGSECRVHHVSMKGCEATVQERDATHAVIVFTKGNETWNPGDKTRVGVWWLEAMV